MARIILLFSATDDNSSSLFMLVVFKPPLIQINNHLITETDTLRLWRTHHDQKGMNTKFSQCSMFIVISRHISRDVLSLYSPFTTFPLIF